MSDLPLSGIRVVDLTISWAGPFATRMFSTMGAEVIRIENPNLAPGRPYFMSSYVNDHNINKYSLSLDLSKPRGKELFKQLVGMTDVVAENFSARVMGQLGLDYDTLKTVKPDIIMLSMPGFGSTGPYRDYISYGTVIDPMTGLAQLTGYADGPPLRVATAYPDPTAGLLGAFALLSALRYRDRAGKGQHIELSQFEGATGMIGEAIMDYTMNRRVQKRQGNRHPSMAPHEVYPCKGEDSWIAIAVAEDSEWQALCNLLGRPELAQDPRFDGVLSRYEHQDELNAIIADWTRQFDHSELMHWLQAAGVPAGAVLTARELVADPHLKDRGFFVYVDDPADHAIGARPIQGPLAKLSRTPGVVTSPSPLLGQHNDYILGNLLGLSKEERARLVEDGIILRYPPPDLEGQVPPPWRSQDAT